MKNIELTEKHKSKLLKMCKKLFPEYTLAKQPIMSNMIIFDNSWFNGQGNNIIHTKFISIHWFEFCMTHLQDKIKQLDGFKYDPDCDISLMSCWYESHPIDFLYEEFKKFEV